MAFKYCPSCQGEYQSWATRCHDCDVSLDAPADAPTESVAPSEGPATDELQLVREGPTDWLERLAERLANDGIACWIAAGDPTCATGGQHGGGCGTRLGLWVRLADAARAAEIDADHARVELPELAAQASGDDRCPACDAPCGPEATACDACGLTFAS